MFDDEFSPPTEMDVIREVYPLYFPPEFGWGSVLDDHRFVVTAQLFCDFFKRREGDELLREVRRCEALPPSDVMLCRSGTAAYVRVFFTCGDLHGCHEAETELGVVGGWLSCNDSSLADVLPRFARSTSSASPSCS